MIHKKIGKGTFGKVFSGLDIKTNKLVALKIEYAKRSRSLIEEAKVLRQLAMIKGIPRIRACGKVEQNVPIY